MKQFEKLIREEMKKVKGGVGGSCVANTFCNVVITVGGYRLAPGKCDVNCVCVPDGGAGSGTCYPNS